MAHLHTADSFQVKIYKAMLIFRGFSICCIKGKYKLVAVLQKDTNLQKRRDRQMVQRAIKPMTIIATQKFVYKYFSNIIIFFNFSIGFLFCTNYPELQFCHIAV